jgi:hypothetical protein
LQDVGEQTITLKQKLRLFVWLPLGALQIIFKRTRLEAMQLGRMYGLRTSRNPFHQRLDQILTSLDK